MISRQQRAIEKVRGNELHVRLGRIAVRRPSQSDRAIENHSCSQRKTSIRKALRRQCNKVDAAHRSRVVTNSNIAALLYLHDHERHVISLWLTMCKVRYIRQDAFEDFA